MALENLHAPTRLYLPNTTRFVAACGENATTLRIEAYFTDLTLVADQDCLWKKVAVRGGEKVLVSTEGHESSGRCKQNTTALTWHAPVMVLKTRLVPSAEALTSLEPVQLNDTSRISSLWPRRVWMHCPDATSQTLQVRSIEPLMQRSPP
mmetsp:Transcript_21016/g.41636  ORF Transcript_21016/g.41636 Transcript_21016/m.41636 type:complete len:150 (-) Transcript_21016:1020-1469(-)